MHQIGSLHMPFGLLPRILSYSDPPLECLKLSIVKNRYHNIVKGIVVKCHNACASMSHTMGESRTPPMLPQRASEWRIKDNLASGRRKWIMDQMSQIPMNVTDRAYGHFHIPTVIKSRS